MYLLYYILNLGGKYMFGLNELLTGGNDFHVWQDTFTLFLFYSSIDILI